jgi:methylase of polypeptide subunit release factors
MPVADRSAAAALGAALRRLDYTEDALDDLLGDDSHSSRPSDLLVHARRLPATRQATAIRLLFLAQPVARDEAARALGELGVEALAATHLADVGTAVVPLARVIPVHDLLLAADGFSRGDDDPPDYVAPYTPTSRLCDALTPRPRVRSALDVGTGSGVHALLAARHAERVVATDVNPRALAFTELNAALNDLSNVEARRGGLFDPAGDETFDLITCNAPFVVSPETRWAYRDTELPGDELSGLVVREAAARLTDDGFATLLVSWLADDPERPHDRALEWVRDTPCDAWILPVYAADPLDHAAGWNDHLADDPDEFGAAVDRWVSYLDGLGARWVSEGAILLHRRAGAVSARVDEVDEDELDMADRQIRRAFANRAAQLRGKELLETPLVLAPAARVEQIAKRGKVVSTRVVLEEGTHPAVDVPPRLAGPLAKLDGKTRFRFEQRDGRYLRELLELGVLAVRP